MNNPPPILSTSQIREVERVVLEQPNAPSLMEQAGLAAATIAQEKMLTSTDQRILVWPGALAHHDGRPAAGRQRQARPHHPAVAGGL